MERAIHCYRDVFGLRFVSRNVVARFDLDGVFFGLVATVDGSNPQGSGNARQCLRVENMEPAKQELRAQGVFTYPPGNKGSGILTSLHHPEGNEVCLWQYSSVR